MCYESFKIYMNEQRPESVRTSVLLRKLSEEKTLTPEETREPSENHYNMAGSNVIAKIEVSITRLETIVESYNARQDAIVESFNARQDAIVESFNTGQDVLISRLDALKDSMDRQHSTLLWVIGIATALLGAIQIFT